MKCTKCKHILPDDSEFCQYCGSRIEKTARMPQAVPAAVMPEVAPAAVMPEVTAAVVMPEASAAREVLVSKDAASSTGAEPPNQSSEKAIPPMPDFNNRVPDVPEKAPKEKKVKQPKRKYCSHCGSLIDPQTKQCTGCGKKYFRGIKINKFAAAITLLSLILAASIGLNVLQYLDNSRVNEEWQKTRIKIENLEAENENLEQKNVEFRREVADLKTTVNNQRTTIQIHERELEDLEIQNDLFYAYFSFCQEHVAVIGDDGTTVYHQYGCNKLDMSRGFWIFSTDAAEHEGYTRCSHCH